ncbi:glycoside hydrolase 43 family protein [Vibrio sp. HA2012]|uniref:glycoside hydrolase family 43 protein n=1 Tax=Vibrio sp. HA2012 TaxID=1971595 RepID=UPI000C2BAEBA|nr:glycoside hydrolase family 43 protein [Vibrio sp. HA2012]PJC87510.1 glycoside hydrolase 43 family protein [Vibrio sp. HA2012]
MNNINPILPGFYPDPSICRVNDDYYLITSSFAFFPGIPIFHSKDLVNWTQLGHVLERPSQLNLDGSNYSGGIFAPTIRHHDGIFYVITTNMTYGGNFLVYSKNPSGPWSDPVWLPDAPGIDPSLFFDDDGRVYVTGTRTKKDAQYFGDHEIWIQELDLLSLTLIGTQKVLWDGAMKNAMFVEAPHLYKRDEYYYLMISEGGTEQYHSITIARSNNIMGKYISNPANPILTHRHLGKSHPITNIGHGDLIQTSKNDWYMVTLGCRPCHGSINLGRETFITDVIWEDGWPVIAPGIGCVNLFLDKDTPLPAKAYIDYPRDTFASRELSNEWNFIRTPRVPFWYFENKQNGITIKLKTQTLLDHLTCPSFEYKKHTDKTTFIDDCPAFIGRRIQHHSYSVISHIVFTPESMDEEAGIAIVQNSNHQFRYYITRESGSTILVLVKCYSKRNLNSDTHDFNYKNIEKELAKVPFDGDELSLSVNVTDGIYDFYYTEKNSEKKMLTGSIDSKFLSVGAAGGFVGNYIGLYATSNNMVSSNTARFEFFEYKPTYS